MRTDTDHLGKGRVRRHTSRSAAASIDDKTAGNVRYYAAQPRDTLNRRIEDLEREDDMEKILETNASLLALSGAILGTTVNRKFFLLTGAVLGFLTQHATTGWCPPVPILRALGVRTRAEIDQERFALKALRGDFRSINAKGDEPSIEKIMQAIDA